jgi:hypothetical protein
MTSIDWTALGREAADKRAQLWDTIIGSMERAGDAIPEVAPVIRDAYVGLRLDYLNARACLLSGRAPSDEDLDPPLDENTSQISAFKDRVLTFMAQIEAACLEADGSPDDEELAKQMANELMKTGRASDPLT